VLQCFPKAGLLFFWHCNFYSSFILMLISLAVYLQSFKWEDVPTELGETFLKEGDA